MSFTSIALEMHPECSFREGHHEGCVTSLGDLVHSQGNDAQMEDMEWLKRRRKMRIADREKIAESKP